MDKRKPERFFGKDNYVFKFAGFNFTYLICIVNFSLFTTAVGL